MFYCPYVINYENNKWFKEQAAIKYCYFVLHTKHFKQLYKIN